MISFAQFEMRDGSPIYTQIVRHIQRGVAAGTICHGDELPSRRTLSALLGVNPNTVQKAYRILEDEGLITSRPGAGSCVVADEETRRAIRQTLLENDVGALVETMGQMGVSKAELQALLDRLWR